jgi:hypothetical protein
VNLDLAAICAVTVNTVLLFQHKHNVVAYARQIQAAVALLHECCCLLVACGLTCNSGCFQQWLCFAKITMSRSWCQVLHKASCWAEWHTKW